MTLDYTSLLKKLAPYSDGEPLVSLRTMTVSVVNADGTVDLTTSGGVTIPGVARLSSAVVSAGQHVQVLSGRGVLLVLGMAQRRLPAAMLTRNTVQAHASGSWTAVTLNNSIIDTHGGFSGGAYSVPFSGIYDVSFSGTWAFNATGRRGVRVTVNGVAPTNYPAIIVPTQTGSGELSIAGASVLLDLNAGDDVGFEQFQNSGISVNNGAAVGYYPSLRVKYHG